MDELIIEKIVKKTIDELTERNLLKDDADMCYMYMNKKLFAHFSCDNDERIARALQNIKNDPYYDIIDLYYKKGSSIMGVAIELNYDMSTIVRNKKRLVLSLYSMVYGSEGEKCP